MPGSTLHSSAKRSCDILMRRTGTGVAWLRGHEYLSLRRHDDESGLVHRLRAWLVRPENDCFCYECIGGFEKHVEAHYGLVGAFLLVFFFLLFLNSFGLMIRRAGLRSTICMVAFSCICHAPFLLVFLCSS